jgi:dTDP-4-dehydrorhamnose reductase
MNILLLGKDGQLGRELQRTLSPLGNLVALSRSDADFENPDALQQIVRNIKPGIIVNAAAYTAVDKAEDDFEKAVAINAKAVKALAETAKELDAWLVHYSTDYVFDGKKDAPYLETDLPSPLNKYGESKWQGEKSIIDIGGKYLIFRTSWVYAAHGKNFAQTILSLAMEQEELNIVADQFGAPTSAELVAKITAQILHTIKDGDQDYTGLYHLVADGYTNWHEYARYLVTLALEKGIELKAKPDKILPVSTAEYPTAAARPKNSRLNTNKIKNTFGVTLPDWKYHLQQLLDKVSIQ